MGRYDKFRSTSAKRPKGSSSFDAVLPRLVRVIWKGEPTKLPAEEAFLLQLRGRSRLRDDAASELLREYIDLRRESSSDSRPTAVHRVIVAPGSVSRELELLRIAKKFDRYDKKAYMKLQPWIVEAALNRLGTKQLTLDEQRTVFNATRTPHKVQWPSWWEIDNG